MYHLFPKGATRLEPIGEVATGHTPTFFARTPTKNNFHRNMFCDDEIALPVVLYEECFAPFFALRYQREGLRTVDRPGDGETEIAPLLPP
jgi:hypothetical protein